MDLIHCRTQASRSSYRNFFWRIHREERAVPVAVPLPEQELTVIEP